MPLLLYVEDEENDVILLTRAFAKWAPGFQIVTASDGIKAIQWLENRLQNAGADQLPLSLVLLDLNLPRKNGFEVLDWIRKHPAYASLPVIIYTSSDHQSDIQRAQELKATDYKVKSGVIADAQRLIQSIALLSQSPPALS